MNSYNLFLEALKKYFTEPDNHKADQYITTLEVLAPSLTRLEIHRARQQAQIEIYREARHGTNDHKHSSILG